MDRSIGRWRVSGTVAAMLLVGALVAPQSVGAADVGIDIAGFAFSPQSVTVHVGDTVTWSNADLQSHTATADDGSWNTGTISGNGSKSVTLTTAGTFAYHCSIHRSMTATLVVSAAAPPATDTIVIAAAAPSPTAWIEIAATLAFVLGLLVAIRRFGGSRGDAPPA
jgi:plastocyanin